MNKLYLTLIPVYATIASVLTQLGFSSYFNIPSNFVENSVPQNIIYFFQLGLAVLAATKLWMWLVLGIIVVILFFLSWLDYGYKKVILAIIWISLAIALINFQNFGIFLAKNQNTFYVLSSDCSSVVEKNKTYVMLGSYQDKAIIVPIIKNTKKMDGTFSFMDISTSPCKISQENIGKIIE
jgi:hypothetical protein